MDDYWIGFLMGLVSAFFGIVIGNAMHGGPTVRHDSPIRPELSITVDTKTGVADTTYVYRKP